jgi:hypothetical protein
MSRYRAAYLIDILIVVLATVAIVLWATGGFYKEPFGIRISARRPDRPMLAALALAALRWWWWRGQAAGFLGRPASFYRSVWARVFQRGADGETLTGGAARGASTLPRGHWAWSTLGIVAVGAVLLQGQLRQMRSVPDLGDPLFSMWRMGWVAQQLAGDPRPLFDANIFFPQPLTFTLSDSMLLPAATAAPLLWAGVPPVIAYNLLFLSGFLLSGIATYLLLVRITGSPPAAFIGGLLYAFHPYRLEHYSHLELQMTQWMPLALLFLHRFADRLRARDLLIAAVCMVAQLYSSMYYGVYFPLFATVVFGVVFVVTRPALRRLVVPVAVSAVVALALAVPLARPYIEAQKIKGDRDTHAVTFYSADLSDYLRPHPRVATWDGRLLADINPERALFPGLTPIALTAVALAPPLGTFRFAYAAALVVGFDLSHGLKGFAYPYLYRSFPPIRGMRVPARFSIILGISLVVLAAFGARRLLDRCRTARARHLFAAGLVAVVMIDLRPALDVINVWPEPPPIYQSLSQQKDVVLAEFPFELHLERTTNDLPYMYFSLWHWLPMANGYSGFIPDHYEPFARNLRGFPDALSIASLRMRGVSHVTINCGLMREGCETLVQKADAAPELRFLNEGQWQGRVVKVYRLEK